MNAPLRIAIYGPESTGKSTLTEKLAAHFRAPFVTEYAREFWDAHGAIGLEDIPAIAREQWRREDAAAGATSKGQLIDDTPAAASLGQCHLIGDIAAPGSPVALGKRPNECHLIGDIAAAPVPSECHIIDDNGAGPRGLVICDTDALTTMLWSDLLYGTTPDEVRHGAEKRCRNYALYLLLDVDVPFAPDPQRCFPDPADREKYLRVFRGALERRHLPFVQISGDWPARERAAIAAVEELLKA